MPPRSTLISAALLIAGVTGIALIAFALTSSRPTETSPRDVVYPPSLPTATSTSAHASTLTGTPTSSPTPTPTPIPISPPFVSPTGRLAYVEDGRLSVVETDGSRAVVAEGGVAHGPQALVWSPDGRRLLYEASTDRNESAHHVWDSTTNETLHLNRDIADFPPEGESFQDPVWSPAGTRLLFRTSPDEPSGGAWVVDVASTRAWAVARRVVSGIVWVDEGRVLYRTSKHLRLVTIGPPARPLTGTLGSERSDTGVSLSGLHALSPDRRYLALLDAHNVQGSQLQVHPLLDAPPLTSTVRLSVTAAGEAPLWSPDGRWIAYGARATASDQHQGPYAVLVDAMGISGTRVITGLRPLRLRSGQASAWSPDSRLLAGPTCPDVDLEAGSPEEDCGLAVADASSDRVVTLASGQGVRVWDLAWSPRGVYLAYSLTGPGAELEGLVLWNRGTDERRLLMAADGTHPLTDLQWAPDGCRLYVAQRRHRSEEARSVRTVWGLGPVWEDHWRIASARGIDPEGEQDGGPRPCPAPLLAGRRLVAYYGTPLGGLGILGRGDITATLTLLNEQVRVYRALDPDVETIPGFHMITTIADDHPGGDEDYNHRVDHAVIRRWIDGIGAAGGWAVLDVQPGRAGLDAELDLIEPFLREPTVHLAVDPEFMVEDEEVPGNDLGRITGPQVNQLQTRLERLGRAIGRRKILIVHQFDDRMVEQKDAILDYPFVELVWDADGFGGPWPKAGDYEQYRGEAGFEHGGFKLFYQHDNPLMTPEQVLALEPPPRVVIYQ